MYVYMEREIWYTYSFAREKTQDSNQEKSPPSPIAKVVTLTATNGRYKFKPESMKRSGNNTVLCAIWRYGDMAIWPDVYFNFEVERKEGGD